MKNTQMIAQDGVRSKRTVGAMVGALLALAACTPEVEFVPGTVPLSAVETLELFDKVCTATLPDFALARRTMEPLGFVYPDRGLIWSASQAARFKLTELEGRKTCVLQADLPAGVNAYDAMVEAMDGVKGKTVVAQLISWDRGDKGTLFFTSSINGTQPAIELALVQGQ